MKKSLLAAVLAMAEVGFATPVVSDVVARQRYPWNGMVDIGYTITGSLAEPNQEVGVKCCGCYQ